MTGKPDPAPTVPTVGLLQRVGVSATDRADQAKTAFPVTVQA